MSPANIIPNSQLTKVLLSVPETLNSPSFDVLFPKGYWFHQEKQKWFIELENEPAIWTF